MFTQVADNTTTATATYCGSHAWLLESLRGSNRNHRVETVRCWFCEERRRRVWDSWTAKKPTTVRRLTTAREDG